MYLLMIWHMLNNKENQEQFNCTDYSTLLKMIISTQSTKRRDKLPCHQDMLLKQIKDFVSLNGSQAQIASTELLIQFSTTISTQPVLKKLQISSKNNNITGKVLNAIFLEPLWNLQNLGIDLLILQQMTISTQSVKQKKVLPDTTVKELQDICTKPNKMRANLFHSMMIMQKWIESQFTEYTIAL